MHNIVTKHQFAKNLMMNLSLPKVITSVHATQVAHSAIGLLGRRAFRLSAWSTSFVARRVALVKMMYDQWLTLILLIDPRCPDRFSHF